MKLPLQITFRHMEPSPAFETRIHELTARLEKFCDQIMRCRVVVEAPHRHNSKGKLYDIRIDITVPDKEIAIRLGSPNHHAHENPYVALRDSFRAARRQLQDYQRERSQQVKVHVSPPQGYISELYPAEDFGRILTDDGRLIYFHRHSVLGRSFDKLTTGTRVRFAEEAGDKGPQASTVHVAS
jgi:cold shock CspA family protein/ribosome-associated translation inhibitor RaiA